MADKPDKTPGLTDQINELEELVEKKSIQSRVSVVGDQVIPILDELVLSEHPDDGINFDYNNADQDPEYNQLVEAVEEKLSHELDEIVGLLKGNLKDSILHELQDRLNKGSNNSDPE